MIQINNLSVDKILTKAKAFEQQNDQNQAAILYRHILNRYPGNIRAKKALANLESKRLVCSYKQNNSNKYLALLSQGKFKAVIKAIAESTEDDQHNFTLLNILGAAHKGLGNLEAAEDYFRRASILDPSNPESYNNLGFILAERQEFDKAIKCYKTALKLNPNDAEVYNNMGNSLKKLELLYQAVTAYKKSIELRPDYAKAHNNLGNLLLDLGLLKQSSLHLQKAIELQPNYPEAFSNLGLTFIAQGKYIDALNIFDKAIKLKPCLAQAHNNKGNALKYMGRLEDSRVSYQNAIKVSEDFLDPSYNLSLLYLKKGEWAAGWADYEYRFDVKKGAVEKFITCKPRWDYRYVKSLFAWGEQGVGDEVMFASCIEELKNFSDHLTVSCDERLLPLFNRSFSQDISFVKKVVHVESESFNSHVPLGSAFGFLRQTDESFRVARTAYLKADRKRIDYLRKRLELQINGQKFIVGISWRSSANKDASKRSINLLELAKAIPNDFQLVNLQYGEVSSDLDELKRATGREVLTISEVDNYNNLDDFCALIKACDLVISIDNSTVHFAGALGQNCYVLLPFSHQSDWRWGLNGSSKSYQYDSLSLLWQKFPDDWKSCLKNLQEKLGKIYKGEIQI